jgi:signal transduction histidine kinase
MTIPIATRGILRYHPCEEGMRHRRLILFMALVLLPGTVLLAATMRLARQDRELALQRQREARAMLALQLGQELRARLDRMHAGETAPGDAVVLHARLADGRLILPWEEPDTDSAAPSAAVTALLTAGARSEFAAGRPADAAASYARAVAEARDPRTRAGASLLHARALRSAGRSASALHVYHELAAQPLSLRDGDGMPVALYAADALLAAGDSAAALPPLEALAIDTEPVTPAALYAALALARQATASGDGRQAVTAASGSGAADSAALVDRLQHRLDVVEEVMAHRGELPSLLGLAARATGRPERVWLPYGRSGWLLGAPGAQAGAGGRIVIVRGDALLREIAREPGPLAEAAAHARITDDAAGADPPGAGFAGLHVLLPPAFPLVDDGAHSRSLLIITLPLVLGLMLFTAYLLWRDVRREVAAAALRSRFVSSVSHELKTPLTSIRMFAEMLRLGHVPVERRDEYLDTVVHESERLTRLINNVLDFSRIDQGEQRYDLRPVRLGDVVADAVQAMSYPLAQDGFELELRIDDTLPLVLADRDAITQAVLNLLSNALKYAGASRCIRVETVRDGDTAVIRVADRGPGVRADERRVIFEPYYRSQSAQDAGVPGTGLGLALVAHIARGHGGSADVEPAPGGGSIFSVRIPPAHAAAAEGPPS